MKHLVLAALPAFGTIALLLGTLSLGRRA